MRTRPSLRRTSLFPHEKRQPISLQHHPSYPHVPRPPNAIAAAPWGASNPNRQAQVVQLRSGRVRAQTSMRLLSTGAGKLLTYNPPAEVNERVTPVLLLPGEGLSPACWDNTASFLAQNGFSCMVTSFHNLGVEPESELTIDDIVKRLHTTIQTFMPPVVVAHGAMGFVAQKYLESFAAAGLLLINSLPPSPAHSASKLLEIIASTSHPTLTELASQVQGLTETHKLKEAEVEPFPMKLLRDMQSDPETRLVLEPEVVGMRFIHTTADTIMDVSQVRTMAEFHGYSDNEITVLAGASSRAPMLEDRGTASTSNALHDIILEFVDEY